MLVDEFNVLEALKMTSDVTMTSPNVLNICMTTSKDLMTSCVWQIMRVKVPGILNATKYMVNQ